MKYEIVHVPNVLYFSEYTQSIPAQRRKEYHVANRFTACAIDSLFRG